MEKGKFSYPGLMINVAIFLLSVTLTVIFVNPAQAKGGLDWPGIPGLKENILLLNPENLPEERITSELPSETLNLQVLITPEPQSKVSASNPNSSVVEPGSSPETYIFIERFMLDPAGNSVAVLTLLGMLVSVVTVGYYFIHIPEDDHYRYPRALKWPNWAVPVLCLAGLGVAGYMSYVEITHVEAICGPLGDCNSVQQSPYATLFGFLPVGVLGMVGYIGIGVTWFLYRYGPKNGRNIFAIGTWGMTLLGTLFSIYLTFLEPFVIGATCAWCISSAVIITLILWATTMPAIKSIAEHAVEE
jgi:uncharacterized membrane protein